MPLVYNTKKRGVIEVLRVTDRFSVNESVGFVMRVEGGYRNPFTGVVYPSREAAAWSLTRKESRREVKRQVKSVAPVVVKSSRSRNPLPMRG